MLMIQSLELMGVNLMDNGIIVIDSDGNVVEKELGKFDHHVDLLREYLEEKQLTYSTYKTDTSYQISYYLASILEISAHIENDTYIYFLGNKITDKQYEYFKINRRILKKHNTIFGNMEDDSGVFEFYDEFSYPDCNIFDLMMEKIWEKEIISTENFSKERK